MANMMAPGGFATTKVCRHDDCADERCRRMEAHDALLDPCCAKDQKDRRQASKWMAQLRAADPARKALDARRGAVDVARGLGGASDVRDVRVDRTRGGVER